MRAVLEPLLWRMSLIRRMLASGVLPRRRHRTRRLLAEKYLSGKGLEIGALQMPVPLPGKASVRYVDQLTPEEARARHPEIQKAKLVLPDVFDNGETLDSILDGSVDFIIANHVLEHCENPCGTVRTHLRKLGPGGILYYAVPDKRLTFDHRRRVTTFEHLIDDDRLGPEAARYEHYRDFVEHTSGLTDPSLIEREVQRLMQLKYRIHFHVWDKGGYGDFLRNLREYLRPSSFETLFLAQNGVEVVAILRKEDRA